MAKFNLPFGLNIAANDPTDTRQVVVNQAGREALVTDNLAYEGMVVYQADNSMLYVLEGTTNNDWETIGSSSGGDVLSVNGQQGNVVLGTDDIAEGTTNLYNRVPTGGTAGQVLSKIDGSNYNTQWTDVSGGVTAGIGITDNAGTFDLGTPAGMYESENIRLGVGDAASINSTFDITNTDSIIKTTSNSGDGIVSTMEVRGDGITGRYMKNSRGGSHVDSVFEAVTNEAFVAVDIYNSTGGYDGGSYISTSSVSNDPRITLNSSLGTDNTNIDQRSNLIEISGTGSFPGMSYDQDYSANYTNRSLVDKEYVDNNSSSVTAGIGITESLGVFDLGASNMTNGWTWGLTSGNTTGNISVNPTSYSVEYANSSSPFGSSNGKLDITGSFFRLQSDYSDFDGNNKRNAIFQTSNGSIYLSSRETNPDGSGNLGESLIQLDSSMNTTPSKITTSGSTGFAGIEYDQDYSANYTDRSLVDKAYVDSQSGGGPSNAITTENTNQSKEGWLALGKTATPTETLDVDGNITVSGEVLTNTHFKSHLGTVVLQSGPLADFVILRAGQDDNPDNTDLQLSPSGSLFKNTTLTVNDITSRGNGLYVNGDATIVTDAETVAEFTSESSGVAGKSNVVIKRTNPLGATDGIEVGIDMSFGDHGFLTNVVSGPTPYESKYNIRPYNAVETLDPYFTIDYASGFTGINTPEPTERLEVTGNIKSTAQIEGSTLLLTPQAAPTSPTEGTTYYDSTTKVVYVWDGTTWQNVY